MSPRTITPEEIAAWATSTFGPQPLRSVGLKLHEEVLEVLLAIDRHNTARPGTAEQVGEELCDVFIVLVQLAARIYGPHSRFMDAVTDKMQTNTQRQWSLDAEGLGQHLPNLPNLPASDKDSEQ